MEAAQHNNALPTAQQQHCTAVGKLVAKYRIALQNRTLPMLCKLSQYSRVSIPRSIPGQQIVSQVSSVSLFWRMRSLKLREQVLCTLGGVGSKERATAAVIIMWSGEAGNVRDCGNCGIISAALYLVTSNYYNVPPTCGAAALTCYWSRTSADFETKLLSKMLF